MNNAGETPLFPAEALTGSSLGVAQLGPGGPAAGRTGPGTGSHGGNGAFWAGWSGLGGRQHWGEVAGKGLFRRKGHLRMVCLPKLEPSSGSPGSALFSLLLVLQIPFGLPTGLNSEKVAALIQKLNSDPQFVLAQNVGTTHDLLDICLKRATVQGAQHVFQHAVTQEGKPVTNQKSSGEVLQLLARFA